MTTNSLTKVYGLSGLRCGWILAEPGLATSFWRLQDLMTSSAVHAAERISCFALANLQKIGQRARQLIGENRLVLERFFDERADLEAIRMDYGTTSFPRLKQGSVDALCENLHENYETTVVPGRFFEMPQHFRIGLGCEEAIFRNGLERLSQALDELS